MVWHDDSSSAIISKYMPLININVLLVGSQDELKSTLQDCIILRHQDLTAYMVEDPKFDEVVEDLGSLLPQRENLF